ncbi:sugar kinase [Arthrobacter tecti]
MNGIEGDKAIGGVVTFGETMALFASPSVGALSQVPSLNVTIGGAESNVAIALKRLGAPVRWLGVVGEDSLGDLVERHLLGEGIQTLIHRRRHLSTGLMIKERRTTLAQRIWYYRAGSAGASLSPVDLPPSWIEDAAILHLTGITPALSKSARQTVTSAIERAKSAGTKIVFDLNYRSSLWTHQEAKTVYQEIISRSDIVFAGENEADIATGRLATPEENIRTLADLGPQEVIIKQGSAGCLASINGTLYDVPAIKVPIVDTVGAGDAFVAGYLADYLQGQDPEDRLSTAIKAGAYACMAAGDWEGTPTRTDLCLLDSTEPVQR